MDGEKWIALMVIAFFGVTCFVALAYVVAIIWALVRVTLHFT